MSSKADDFDVRFRDAGDGRPWGSAADGGYQGSGYAADVQGGAVDYDLGYDANGWDTQGFRSPTAGYLDQHETGQLGTGTGPRHQNGHGYDNRHGSENSSGNGHGGSHARTASTPQSGPPTWGADPAATQAWLPSGPNQPNGPGGPGGPSGPSGPGRRGRRARQGGSGGPRGPRVKVKGSWWRHWTWRKALGLVLGIVGVFIGAGAVLIAVMYEETPVPAEALAATGYAQSVVYSKDGTLIGRFGTTDRQMLPYNQIPRDIINAVLAAEDRHFWSEGGISPTATIRAALADLTGNNNSLQGGSTITQQFVRNYYQGIGTQQTISRKIKEIFVAMKVAKEKSKQWILANYLNTIYLGQGAYGIQAAAESYFGKPVSKLTVAQDAVIAALIQQPSAYPLPQYRPQLIARWHYVIDGIVQMGNLPAASAAALKFPAFGDHTAQSVGPDVWDPYVLNMVRAELNNVYGLTEAQIDNGGYVITTSIEDSKMRALYAAISQNEAQINNSAYPFKSYMHAGAVLEDPATGAIQAVYAGPGFPGSKYNGTGRVITAMQCEQIQCQYDMATVNREQVGSSFKPYILATAVKEGMNVQSSTLDGFTPLSIPPDTQPNTYPQTAAPAGSSGWSLPINNDSPAENGPYTPQIAMATSINTAYATLWHAVAGPDGMNVLDMAQAVGVDIQDPVSGMYASRDEATLALGQASLTVGEQASMLATIADNGVYHDPHLITSITQADAQIPVKVTSRQVFSNDPVQNAEMDSQVQYAMSEDTNPAYGTAPVAAMSNGQEIIAKTGTTNTAQSAFFEGSIPSQALVVALFTHDQNGNKNDPQTLNLLGGQSQGGYGGFWPATIWHTYAENMFVPLGVEKFQPVVFTGQKWNEVPPNLRNVGNKKPKKRKKKNNNNNPNPNPGNGNGNGNGGNGGNGNPNPYPTYTCDPTVVTCNPNANGATQSVGATEMGAALGGGLFAGLPAACLWARRRTRRRPAKRG